MGSKLVSVIIPTYNRAELVVRAIESVKAQTYQSVQIIVIDDGSNDQTSENVSKIENIEYYFQENKGQAAARNLGLKHVKGEYIASLDSDDIWQEDFLTAAVTALERHQTDFVFLNWRETSDVRHPSSSWERDKLCKKFSKNSRDGWFLLNAAEVREIYLKTCPAPSSALLLRRSSLVSDWNEEMRIADDWCFVLDMAVMKQSKAAFTLKHYWTKHIHSSNIYHGRETLEVIRDLGIHDGTLISERFQNQLSSSENAILKKRLAINYLDFGRLNWRKDGISMNSLRSILTGIKLAPFGCVSYLFELTYHHLKNRFRIARGKKQPSEI